MPRQRHRTLLVLLILTVVLEPLLQLSPQPALLLHDTAPLLQRLSPPLVNRVEADHALALLVVKQLVVVVSAAVDDCAIPAPHGRRKQAVQGVGQLGAPRGGEVGDAGRYRQVLAVAAAVAAHKGEDEKSEQDVKDGGEEEGDEDGLADGVSGGVATMAFGVRGCVAARDNGPVCMQAMAGEWTGATLRIRTLRKGEPAMLGG